jgi:hypothetical protein
MNISDVTVYISGNVLNVGNVFEQKIYQTSFNHEFPYLPRCLNCYPFIQGYSNSEKELTDFCKQYYPNLIENDRQLLNRTRVRHYYSGIKISY